MSLQRIVLDSPLTAAGFKSVCDLAPGQLVALNNLVNYLGAVSGGNQSAKLTCLVGAVQAAATFTVTSTGSVAAQTATLLNVTLTGVASAPTANQFVVSTTPATQAANMAAAINTSASFAGKVTATAALGVVTITSVVPGTLGNGLQVSAGTLANVAAGSFASGTEGTSYVLNLL